MIPPGKTLPESASDIVQDSWVLRLTPAFLHPYLKLARMDRPIGTWLLLFPCWWSLIMGREVVGGLRLNGGPDWDLFLLFAIGAFVMRGAGCTYNDIVDRKIDAQVARTATRPIPSGQVTTLQAVIFLALLLAIGLFILLQLNQFTIYLGIASLALVFTYPFMKRITYWPQAWLGLTFNWGALMGWAAIVHSLDRGPILLYLAGVAWTLGYDTIYAHQDKEDDALIGVKSTALKFGDKTKLWLTVFYGTAIALMLAAGLSIDLSWPFLIGVACVALLFAWQVIDLKLDDPADCLKKFHSNRYAGWFLLFGLYAAGLWR